MFVSPRGAAAALSGRLGFPTSKAPEFQFLKAPAVDVLGCLVLLPQCIASSELVRQILANVIHTDAQPRFEMCY